MVKIALLLTCALTCVAAQSYNNGAGGALRVRGNLLKGYLEQSASGALSGFIVDLLDALKSLAGFSYNLSVQSDGVYGSNATGTWTGLVGALVRNEIDIAAADLTITSSRDSVIDYTTPFASDSYRTLVKKGTASLSGLNYLVERGTAQESFLRNSVDPNVQAIWKNIQANNGLVESGGEASAVDKAAQGGFAYVTSVQGSKALVAANGQVEFLGATLQQNFLAFGVQQGNAWRDRLGIAISQLSESGQLKSMLNKYGLSD